MEDNTSFSRDDQADVVALTADIVSAYVSNNSVPVLALPNLLSQVHGALAGLGRAGTSANPGAKKFTPAQIRKSITPDALISFIDGKPYKTLRRHLTGQGLTIEAYRQRYGLPHDYPTTAATYSAMRAAFARTAGLGRRRRKSTAEADESPAKPARTGKPG